MGQEDPEMARIGETRSPADARSTRRILTMVSSSAVKRRAVRPPTPRKEPTMPITRTLLLSLTLACATAWGEEEKTLTLDQLPPAVKEAVLKQANGAKIKEIEEETK